MLPDGVMAKDIALWSIGKIGNAQVAYKAVEFSGSAIDALSLDQRMAITNMAVEMGAKVGLTSPGTRSCRSTRRSQNITPVFARVQRPGCPPDLRAS